MNAERMNLWIFKIVPGGRVLQVTHEQAMGQGLTIASWTREDVDSARDQSQNVGEQVLESAQDHANAVGEACRFLVQWIGDSGRPLRTLVHRCVPTERPENEHALHADAVSGNATIGQLLSHIAQQQRVINGSIGAVLSAYDRAMAMQSSMMAAQAQLLAANRMELQQFLVAQQTGTPEDSEVTRLKRNALEKLIELGPDIGRMAIAALSNVIAGDAPEATVTAASPPNGSGALTA